LASEQNPAVETDEVLIARQKICPVTGAKLGSMGQPVKTKLGDETVFLCCEACEIPLQAETKKHMARLAPPPTGTVLSIPQQAVIDTGSSKVVYVEREPGVFEGVKVELGPRMGGYYPVLAGLSPGDNVAAAGSFLLDAETRLNPATASTYFGASGTADDGAAPSRTAGPQHEH
jgi:Cu(I)/Ag(I) efflux system membrane fusion protein